MLSCKEVTLLASKAMDTRLGWRERWAVRLHLLYCRGCRRFSEQIQFLRRVARQPGALLAGDTCLSEAARSRIRTTLQGER